MDPFVEQYKPRWDELSRLLDQIDRRGLKALNATELEEFGRLYRQTTVHLAQARAEQRDERLVDHLNMLVARAHAIIYGRTRRRAFRPLAFYASEFPQVFRRTFRYTAVSASVFVGSAIVAYILVVADAGWIEHTAPAGLGTAIQSFLDEDKPAGAYFKAAQGALGSSGLSALLWTHNLQVGLAAFVLGIGLGIGTIRELATNGMMVGSVIALGALAHKPALVVAIMAPHGVIELSAIIICGGAGLRIGYSLIAPGERTHLDALMLAAQDAVKLMLGVAPLFLIAGGIEGTISPIAEGLFRGNPSRIVFGVGTGILVMSYLMMGDRLLKPLLSRVHRLPGGEPNPRSKSAIVPSARDSG